MEQHSGKLVLAILQGEDYEDTVYELNQNGFLLRCSAPPEDF